VIKRITALALLLGGVLLAEFAIYPMGSYATDTGYVIGANGLIRFRPHLQDTLSQKSVLNLQAKYSQKNQFQVKLEPELYFDADATKANGELKFRRWPSLFYGVGNTNCSCEGEDYTPVTYEAAARIERTIAPGWRIGGSIDLIYHSVEEVTADGILDAGAIPGVEDYLLVGLGPSVSYDTRDELSYSTRGLYASLQTMGYLTQLGSDYGFSQYQLDLRKFHTIAPRQVVAAQIMAIHTRDTVPFASLPQLGEYLRAYEDEKFIDRNLLALRLEHRFIPFSFGLLNRLGTVLFAEIGEVKSQVEMLSTRDARVAYGVGLRYAVLRNPRFNLQVDFGWGTNVRNLEIGAGEAF
jgi:outer membrane protein assembly factor BamA